MDRKNYSLCDICYESTNLLRHIAACPDCHHERIETECLLCFEEKSDPSHYVCIKCYNKIKETAREVGFDKIKLHHVRELTLAYALASKKDGLKGLYWQKFDGHKTPDICEERAKLHIEVDGKRHQVDPVQIKSDMLRTYYANKKGYLTLRVPNPAFDKKTRFQHVVEAIKEIADKRSRKWWQFWKWFS